MTENFRQTKSILDRSFRYTPSSATDLRKTFAKVRREQRLQRARQANPAVDAGTAHPPLSSPDTCSEDRQSARVFAMKRGCPWN